MRFFLLASGLALGALLISGCGSRKSGVASYEPTTTISSGAALELSDASFESEVAAHPGTALVDFTAKWCGPCRKLSPVIDRLAAEMSGQVKVAKVDVDKCPQVSSQFRISGIPCLVLFQDGKEIARTWGCKTKEDLNTWIDSKLQVSSSEPAPETIVTGK